MPVLNINHVDKGGPSSLDQLRTDPGRFEKPRGSLNIKM